MKRTTVDQVMTSDVVAVKPGIDFRSVVAVLAEHHISGVPVVDDDSRVLGVVSEADLLHKEEIKTPFVEPKPLHRSRRDRRARAKAHGDTAAGVMTAPAVTIAPGATVAEAARLMDERGVKRLPVTDGDGRLIGIVSRSDLLRVFLKPDSQIREEVLEEVFLRSLWQDPADVEVTVHNGVVTLRGRVELTSLVPIAEHLTTAIDGVVDVINELAGERDNAIPETRYRW